MASSRKCTRHPDTRCKTVPGTAKPTSKREKDQLALAANERFLKSGLRIRDVYNKLRD